jgi:hypothetical protein
MKLDAHFFLLLLNFTLVVARAQNKPKVGSFNARVTVLAVPAVSFLFTAEKKF